jgi:protein-disulfide isomerase
MRWEAHRAILSTRELVRRHWGGLAEVSTPLYQGDSAPEVVEVADYECTFCRRVVASVDSALALGVRVSYLHAPRATTPEGRRAALAALCANEEGRFLTMHHHLMETDGWQRDPDWRREARRAGIEDLDAFAACLEGDWAAARLKTQESMAESLAVTGTPTFLSRDDVIRGTASAEALRALGSSR